MRVIVACECSGAVRDAFIARRHDAISCDLKPTETPGPHYQGDIRNLLSTHNKFDLLIGHPPCTYLSTASAVSLHKDPSRIIPLQEGVNFFMWLYNLDINLICLENPPPLKITNLPPYIQIIQPWYFGDPYTKPTCLWLKRLPPLHPTNVRTEIKHVEWPEGVRPMRPTRNGKNPFKKVDNPFSWVRQKDHLFDPTARSRTFSGIANAMADQWGNLARPYGFF